MDTPQATFATITEDDFYTKYKPVKNHFLNDAPWNGCMFETYGPELDYVRSKDPNKIWTIIDGDDDKLVIVSGYHFVNRFGYMITEEPWTVDMEVIEED